MKLRPHCAKRGSGLSIQLLDNFRSIVSTSFIERKLATGYSYWRGTTRVLKLATYKQAFFIELNYNIPSVAGLIQLSEEEARLLDTGRVRQCYVGSDVKVAKQILLMANNIGVV